MRYATAAVREREQLITRLTGLADTGQRTVEIRTVLSWLGVEWREPESAGPAKQVPPGVDPLTGCAPVVRGG